MHVQLTENLNCKCPGEINHVRIDLMVLFSLHKMFQKKAKLHHSINFFIWVVLLFLILMVVPIMFIAFEPMYGKTNKITSCIGRMFCVFAESVKTLLIERKAKS